MSNPAPTVREVIESRLGILQPSVIERLTAEAERYIAEGYRIDDLTIFMDLDHSWIGPSVPKEPAIAETPKEPAKPRPAIINQEALKAAFAGMSEISLIQVQVEARKLGDDEAVKLVQEELTRRKPVHPSVPPKRGRGRPPKRTPAVAESGGRSRGESDIGSLAGSLEPSLATAPASGL